MKKYTLILCIFFPIPLFILGSNFEYKHKYASQKTLQHEVTVTLKLIQVYVSDKNGNPITDLAKSDFVLYDNSKPVKITEFEKHILSLPVEKSRKEKLQEIQTSKPFAPPKKLPRMTRKFLLFFDFAFNEAGGIVKAKKAALHFIDTQLYPDDEVGIISYDSFKGLTLHEYFTAEHKKVREVVEGFGIKDAGGRAQNIVRDYWEEKEKVEWMEEKLAKVREFEKDNYRSQALNFSQELKELAKALRYIPGNKHIILFSAGITNFILYGEQVPKTVVGRVPKGHRSTFYELKKSAALRDIYEAMSKELAASNSPVYPVNTAGKGSSHFKDRDEMGDYSLRQLAKLSGGNYYDNVANYEEITKQIQKITSSYYVLGYYINEIWDGKYHKIKIKVKRKGCNVFGQGGYFNPKPFTEYSELEKLLHLIDLALSEKPLLQEPLRFPLITLPFSIKGKSNLVAITRIPTEIVKDISGGRMEVVTLIFDRENNVVELKKDNANAVKLAPDDVYFYSFSFLSPDDYDYRVVIRNLETGLGAVALSSTTIPKSLDSGFRLYPPLLLMPKKNARFIKGTQKDRRENTLSISDIYHFDSAQYVPIVKEMDKDTSKILAVVRCSIGGIIEPEIRFSAHLQLTASGKKIPISPLIINKVQEQGNQIFLLELPTGVLQPRKYSLFLFAEELKTQTRFHTISEINVK